MTLRERYRALMADLVSERRLHKWNAAWSMRLDEKIADLKRAGEEKFGPDAFCLTREDGECVSDVPCMHTVQGGGDGSGQAAEPGGSTSVPDVPGGAAPEV